MSAGREPLCAKGRKAALRRALRADGTALSAAARTAEGEKLCAHLAALPAYQNAQTVFCFVGTAQEIDTNTFLQKVLNDGKILCVPFCVPGEKGVMHAKRVKKLQVLRPDAFGIDTPPAGAQTVEPQAIQLAVLPCVAADETGLRLGYGGGYYDRYLPQLSPVCQTVVLCRKARLLPPGAIASEPHDVRAQLVLTEEGLV